MKEIFEAIRESCSALVWSRGVELARAGAVVGERDDGSELSLKVTARGKAVAAQVTLLPEDEDWSCDCRGKDDPCEHVCAAVIAVKRARERGEALPGPVSRAPARVAYRFTRGARGLELARALVRGDEETLLKSSLVTLGREDRTGHEVAAGSEDLTIELALGSRMAGGPLAAQTLRRVLEVLRHAHDVRLDGVVVQVGELRPVQRVRVADEEQGGGFRLTLEVDPAAGEVFENGAVLRGDQLHPTAAARLPDAEKRALLAGQNIPPERAAQLVAEILPLLEQELPVFVQTRRLPTGRVEAPWLQLELSRDGEALHVLPTIVYGDPPRARVDGARLTLLTRQGAVPLRDEAAERELAERLARRLSLRPGRPQVAEGEAALALAETLRTQRVAQLRGAEILQGFRRVGQLEARVTASAEHFDLRFSAEGASGELDGQAVLVAWAAGASLVALPGGGFAPLPRDWLERYGQRVADLLASRQGKERQLPPSARPELAQLLVELDQPRPLELERLRRALVDFEGIPAAPLPADLTATLRGYQRAGIDWLVFLREQRLGALLADDMGLGKTLQVLCALRTPALVVAPTSVLHSWKAELARFRPALRCNVYHGPQRALDDADITLTTYAILRLDSDALAARRWETVVLDEAQQIKNPESQVAQAAYGLDATWRVALTGTPVQNRLEDLWSQLHFLDRGLLGGLSDFRERYARPIENGNQAAAAELSRRVRPFVLRREKREVARELPSRTEVTLHCELSPAERAVYDAILAATRGEVLERLEQGGNVLAALEALLRLRQAACDGALVPGQEALAETTSSKLALLRERLEEATAAGHKALVFSQWTSLLDRVEPQLEAAGLSYLRLDGSTRDRSAVVDAFQADDGPPVLLISLKAGGVGLTLTAADQVFLLDPWWNPAVEDQAADRAHRIGQTRPVLIQRLVAEDTVEERMLTLQQRKRALAAAALAGSTSTDAARLTRDDLLALLA